MSGEIYKNGAYEFNVTAKNDIHLPNYVFYTQDKGTAKIIFDVSKDGLSLSLTEVEEVSLAMILSKGKKYESTYIVKPEIIDDSIIEYVLTDNQISHSGTADCELYIKFKNGKGMRIYRFQFEIKKALIDDEFLPTAERYVTQWEDYEAILNNKYKDLKEQSEKLKEEQDEIKDDIQSAGIETVVDAQKKADAAEQSAKDYVDHKAPLNLELLSLGFEKIRKGQSAKIVAYGDSLTYGYDIYSEDKRPADPNPTPNGTKHTRERASITYPEALEASLQKLYPNVTVKNCGYSGDTVISSFPKWDGENPEADITLFMLGHNDSKNASETISDFIAGYKKIAERALKWGSGVIFLTPLKQRNGTDLTVETYMQAVREMAKEYQAPVVDMAQLTDGISADFYSDSVHFNGKGYNFIGSKVAALFISKGLLNMPKVKAHDSLSVTKEVTGVQYNENCMLTTSEYFPTEDTTEAGKGIALRVNKNGKVYFSFYADEDNLLFLPSVYASSKTLNLKIEMDFQAEPANNVISYAFGTTAARSMKKPLKTATYTTADLNYYNAAALYIDARINASKLMYAPRKGYYTVSIENLDANGINLFNLEFRNARAAMLGRNNLSTLGTFNGDVMTLAAGNYEMYVSGATNIPIAKPTLASLEIYSGGSNRKLYRLGDLVSGETWTGVYNPTTANAITWNQVATEKYIDDYFENKVIFSGAVYMLAGQSYPFDFSKLKSSLFARVSIYVPGTGAQDEGFETFEFQKKDIIDLEGYPHFRSIQGSVDNVKKAFYISTTGTISGHDNNAASPNYTYAIREIWYD